MRIGLVGGTFNPPHIGHLILAQNVQDKLALDKVIFIPTNVPPHKRPSYMPEVSHRFNMIKLAIRGNPYFTVSDCEMKRGGKSYTIDTIKTMREKFPKDELFLIIGSDLAEKFSTWKNYQRIFDYVKVVVAKRKSFPVEKKFPFIFVDIVQVEINSSRIREYIKKGFSVRYLLPEAVWKYICKNNLYSL